MNTQNRRVVEAGLPFIDKAFAQHGFTRDFLKRITGARDLSDLGDVAMDMIEGIGGPFAMAIGSMTSGMSRTSAHNLLLLDHVYDWFIAEDNPLRLPVFYQLVFELDIQRIRMEGCLGDDKQFFDDLLGKFYKKILLHKMLKTVLLMPGWDKPHGVVREFNLLNKRDPKPKFINIMEHIHGIEHLLGDA